MRTGAATVAALLALALAGCGGADTPRGGSGPGRSSPAQAAVYGRLPNGERFTVTTHRYRFHGRTQRALTASLTDGSSTSFSLGRQAQPLTMTATLDCSRKPLTLLLFGRLRTPTDTVQLRSGTTTVAMTRTGLPGAGEIVYGSAVRASHLTVLSARHVTLQAQSIPAPPHCTGSASVIFSSRRKSTLRRPMPLPRCSGAGAEHGPRPCRWS